MLILNVVKMCNNISRCLRLHVCNVIVTSPFELLSPYVWIFGCHFNKVLIVDVIAIVMDDVLSYFIKSSISACASSSHVMKCHKVEHIFLFEGDDDATL